MTDFTVTAGVTSSGVTLNNGDDLFVSSGGSTIATTVNSGGDEIVSSGGVASSTTVNPGGRLDILSGGSADFTSVGAAGFEGISSGGVDRFADITANGHQYVYFGGVATSATVAQGGFQVVSGGLASATTASDNGIIVVTGGGTASYAVLSASTDLIVSSGGTIVSATVAGVLAQDTIFSGGTAHFTLLNADGFEVVFQGGIAIGTILSGSDTVQEVSGGTADTTTVGSGGTQYVFSGGTANSTFVISNGTEVVSSGGTAKAITVGAGGTQFVFSGGLVSSGVVTGGGAFEWVSSGATVSSITVGNGGNQNVGGTAAFTVVSNGGNQNVNGGITDFTVLSNGGAEAVGGGGVANFTVVSNGGQLNAGDAGRTISALVRTGGQENVFNGGTANATTVGSGGQIHVVGGGTASGTVVSGGSEYVDSGAVASGATIASGGFLFVSSGGTVTGATLGSGGFLVAFPGAQVAGTVPAGGQTISAGVVKVSGGTVLFDTIGTVSGDAVGAQATEYVLPAGTAAASLIGNGGTQDVYSGGAASGATVSGNAAEQFIFAGGVAIGTTVEAFGQQRVSAGGNVTGTILGSGGNQNVFSGGTATGTVISGGVAFVNAGGAATGITVITGGDFVFSGGRATGTVVSGGGTETLFGGVASGTTVGSGGFLVVSAAGVASGTVVLSGGIEVLAAAGSIASGTVMSSGGAIDLPYLVFSGTVSAVSLDPATDVLTVTEGASVYTQTLSGNYTGLYFHAAKEQGLLTGTVVTVDGTPCYCRGTLVMTDRGEVPVEDLRIGDRLLTYHRGPGRGAARPIRWIGTRSYAGRFAAANPTVLPVLFHAGALADGMPRRDLFVSPAHAMYLDDVLIPARALVNGSSIQRVEAVERVEYFHLELESHDVILAEGAAAESFVDDDSRAMFHNAAEFHALYPDAARVPARFCAPFVEGGEVLEAIRRRLAARAKAGLARPEEASGPPVATACVPPRADTAGDALEGHLDDVRPCRIAGWARDAASPGTAVQLRIFDNDKFIGEVVADRFRHGLAAAGIGTGQYGFDFAVPGGLSPSERHVIHVRRARDGRDLPNSPRILEGPSPAPDATARAPGRSAPRGCLDQATREWISGWARDDEAPDGHLTLRVLDNGMTIEQVVANQYRPDLEEAGIGDGRYGFEVHIPGGLSPLTRHIIEVRSGSVLIGDPMAIEPAGSFDDAMQQSIAAAVASVGEAAEQERALTFLLAQAERLRQRRAEIVGRQAERRAFRLIRRRLGPWADGADLPKPAPRALVIAARLPDPCRDTGCSDVLSHMRALRRLGYAVSIVAADDVARPAVDDNAAREALAAEDIACHGAPFLASAEEVLRRHADTFEAIYLHGADIAARYLALARAYVPRARILYAVDHLHHVRLARQAEIEERPELLAASHRVRLMECTAAWQADVVLARFEAEADLLRQLVPVANVHVVPWDVRPLASPVPFAARSGVALLGAGGAPDLDAARWLTEVVMPLVWRSEPAIECTLAGVDMPAAIRRLARPGVTIAANIAGPDALLGAVRLTVAPVRLGAGLNGAVLASFAAGVPCAMSEIAAEGLTLPPTLRGLVCGDAAVMAAAIRRLHGDKTFNRAAAEAGMALIRGTFNEDAVTEALRDAIEDRREPPARMARSGRLASGQD